MLKNPKKTAGGKSSFSCTVVGTIEFPKNSFLSFKGWRNTCKSFGIRLAKYGKLIFIDFSGAFFICLVRTIKRQPYEYFLSSICEEEIRLKQQITPQFTFWWIMKEKISSNAPKSIFYLISSFFISKFHFYSLSPIFFLTS